MGSEMCIRDRFLMQQMELREAIGDAEEAADPFAALDKVRKELRVGTSDSNERFSEAAEKKDWATARTVVREWQFYSKLGRDVKAIEARLDD